MKTFRGHRTRTSPKIRLQKFKIRDLTEISREIENLLKILWCFRDLYSCIFKWNIYCICIYYCILYYIFDFCDTVLGLL